MQEIYKNILARLPIALLIAFPIVGVLYFESIFLTIFLGLLVALLLTREWIELSDMKVNLTQIIFFITVIFLAGFLGKIFINFFLIVSLIFWIIYALSLVAKKTSLLNGLSFNNNYLGIFLIQSFIFGLIAILWFDNLYGVNIFFVLFLIILNTALIDITAYLVGSMVGRTPLFSEISPNKTLEGFFGGLFVVIGFMLLMNWYDFITLEFLIVSLCSIPFAFVGDYFESQLKRDQNLKDSGSLLPGHGGVWDRLDSHIAVIPVFAAFSIFII